MRRLLVAVGAALCAAFLSAGRVEAAAALAEVVPHSVTSAIRNVSGGVTVVEQFRDAANAGRFFSSTVTYTRAAAGSLLRARLFSPGSLVVQAALTAAVLGAGYLIEEATQEVLSSSGSTDDGTVQGTCWRINGDGTCFGSPGEALARKEEIVLATYPSYADCTTFGAPFWYIGSTSEGWREDIGGCGSGWIWTWPECAAGNGVDCLVDPTTTPPFPSGPQPATDDELGRDVLPLLDPQVVPYLFIDPLTGQPVDTAESQAEAQRLQDIIRAQDDADPANDPAPDQTVDTSEAPEDKLPDTMTPPGQPAFPTDLEPIDKRDLPGVLSGAAGQVQAFASQVGVTASAGACTIAIPVALGGVASSGTVDFCQFAGPLGTMGTLILAVAYLAAGLIVLRAE